MAACGTYMQYTYLPNSARACVYTATKGILEENMYCYGFTGFPKGSLELGQSYFRFRDACIMRLMIIEC